MILITSFFISKAENSWRKKNDEKMSIQDLKQNYVKINII